ncbi:hypothetical protein EDB19DRAFT_853186 [Suillus lakei]|nr:hypothetical protein EDB19DRAFT_853186 [Suillus lakei]
MSSVSSHTLSEDGRYWRYAQPNASSSSRNPIPCDAPSQSSHVMSRPSNQYNGYAEGFDISVNVKRAFTFEELQSGAYFNSLDESDLQFFGMYGQPVLIPCPEDSDQGGWSLQGQTHMHPGSDSSSCMTAAQYAPHSNTSSFQISKSYTLVDSLGQLSTSTSAQAPSGTRVPATAPAAGHSGANTSKHDSSLIQQVSVSCEVVKALLLTAWLSLVRPLGTLHIHRTSHHRVPSCIILDNRVCMRGPSRWGR